LPDSSGLDLLCIARAMKKLGAKKAADLMRIVLRADRGH
jgi:hypothetical protein